MTLYAIEDDAETAEFSLLVKGDSSRWPDVLTVQLISTSQHDSKTYSCKPMHTASVSILETISTYNSAKTAANLDETWNT